MNLLTLHEVLTNLEPPEKKTTKAEADHKEESEVKNVGEDPTTKLLIARKKSSEKEKASRKLTREMVKNKEACPQAVTGWSGGGTKRTSSPSWPG